MADLGRKHCSRKAERFKSLPQGRRIGKQVLKMPDHLGDGGKKSGAWQVRVGTGEFFKFGHAARCNG